MNCKRSLLTLVVSMCLFMQAGAQDAASLVQKIKLKLDQVNDYRAEGTMKTDVSFLKVPEAQVQVFFRKPDQLKIKNEKGISLVPKGAVSISLNNLLHGNFTALASGTETVNGKKLAIIKLLPTDENADVVLTTLYIDEAGLLVMRAKTTTRDNGSYEVDMEYGRYAAFALPDKVDFTFNTRDYKLPKGLTFDYDDGSKKKIENNKSDSKGHVQIQYSTYIINKGVPDSAFK